jgi:hypothetical protein
VASVDDRGRFDAQAASLPEAERPACWQTPADRGRLSRKRIRLGNNSGKSTALQHADAKGRIRMLLLVTPEGRPGIQMVDGQGKVVRSVAP